MQTRMDALNEIMEITTDFDVLDIGNRIGMTGYIDFIDINEITVPVMKGTDTYGRPFFTVCAEILYADGTNVFTFTTFFRRYTEQNSKVWMACGMYNELITTCGGMNVPQFLFLRDLLKNGIVTFDDGTDDETIQNNIRLINYKVDENTKKVQKTLSYKRPSCIKLSLNKSS